MEILVIKSASGSRSFWRGKRVLLTGHTGFKGAWAALWLRMLGAEVHGFALSPATTPSLWNEIGSGLLATETLADLAELESISATVERIQPQVVIHLAAQALVRRSYADALGTVATNTMGTVHLLESLRAIDCLEAILIVTTDKVYANENSGRNFMESDALGGHDPYSASKAAAEILTHSYACSFFEPHKIPVATARAGNVIGGGDWSEDRLVPDIWRAVRSGQPLVLRSPDATRPWQHVLEPLAGYFDYVQSLVNGSEVPRALNFGPLTETPVSVRDVASAVGAALGCSHPLVHDTGDHPPEMTQLSLNSSLAKSTIGWRPRISHKAAIDWTARWYARHLASEEARSLCEEQILQFEALENE